jgi:hypothetical protein
LDFGFWEKFGKKNCINFGKILDFGKNLGKKLYKFWEDFGFWGKFGIKICINFGKILDFGKNLD